MSDGRDHKTFEQRLADARAKAGLDTPAAPPSTPDFGSATSLATRVIAELTIPIVLAAALGWWLDRVFHCPPWLLILGVPFGMAAGIRGVLRSAGGGK